MIKRIQQIYILLLAFPTILFSQNESTQGDWGAPIPFGIVPVAVANLPDGNLITWSSQFRGTFIVEGDGMTFTELFNPFENNGLGQALGDFTSNTDHDMFCPGINNLADGRILSAGGTSSEKTSIYDWRTNKWTVADQMNIPRGYQGNVTLSDGSVFTLGGSWSGGNYGNRDAEIYSSLTGWLRLPNIQGEDIYTVNDLNSDIQGQYRVDNHLWLWPAPNGKLFHAGPSEMMHWIDVDSPGGAIVEAGIRQDLSAGVTDAYSMKGNTVMFDIGKILKTGGAPTYGDDYMPELPARNNSFVIDINGSGNTPTPTVTFTGNMNNHRTMHNSTVLPNGEVLVTGGLTDAAVFTDVGAVLGAEIFNPNATGNKWRTVAGMTIPRTYHSVAILMVDGRVFVGGGGLCDSSPGCENHMDAEIYSPPYLFNANNTLATRPVISNGPETADYNSNITVTATSGIQEFSLIRFSAATHSTNNEQRRIPVSFTTNGGTYNVAIPERELLPPGYYMLFALDANGVPSIAHTIKIGSEIPLSNNSNLVLDMQFDESSGINATDSSQYNHIGTIVQRNDNGSPATPNQYTWSNGIIGNALEFDGLEFNSNSLLEIDYSTELASTAGSITVSAWVYRNSSSGITELNGKIANVGILSQAYPNMFFGFHNTLYKWAFRADSPLDCYAGYAPLDTWVHLAATYDGSVAKLYANGVEICSRAMSGDITFLNDATELSSFTASGFYEDGSRSLPAASYGNESGITDEISGKMDLLRVYNKVLDPAEIQALYQEGLNTNNPDITNCAGNYLTVEYRIGLSGQWIESNTIVAPEGAEVFIRPKGYSGEYFLTTSQYDGPTYSNVSNPSRFTNDNAYKLDTYVSPAFNLSNWNNPDRNNGFVDSSNEGQFVFTTPGGCPTTIYFSLVNNNIGNECPDYLPNEDPTIFITSGSLNGLLDEANGTKIETNFSECALEVLNDSIDVVQFNRERFAHFSSSIKIADYGIEVGDEIYVEIDGKGTNSAAVEVYRNNDPTISGPLVSASFPSNWLTRSATFFVPANTQTLDVWMYSNYGSTSPGRAYFDNLKIINLTATNGNYPPTAEFSASTLSGNGPLLVNFNADASTDDVGISQYVWKFGDGTTSSLKNPSHTYTDPGIYLAKLSVYDTGGLRDEKTIKITVLDSGNISPVAVLSANPTSGTVPLNVAFTGSNSTDDGVLTYNWDFADGSTSGIADPTHTFTSSGVYNVTLTVTDTNNVTDTESITITVNDVPNQLPVAVLSANPTSGTVPLNVAFTGSNSTDDGALTYNWDFADGSTSNLADPTHTFTSSGVFNVTLTVTDTNNVTDTESITITVNDVSNQLPVAVLSANPTSGTVPLNVAFTGSNSTDDGALTYNWDFADGSTSNLADPTHTFTSSGVFNVTLTVTDTNNVTDTESITITVNSLTNQAPVATINATPISGGTPLFVEFTGSNSTDDIGIVSYLWDFADGTTSTDADPYHTFTSINDYIVSLTVTDTNGITDTENITISVNNLANEAPVAVIAANPTSGNTPLTVNFTGSNSTDDNGIATYFWDFADGTTSDLADPVHTFNGVLDYEVALTVTDANGVSNTQTVLISVNDLPNEAPVAIISANPISGNSPLTVNFTGSNSTDDNGIVTYLWDFADGTTSDLANPSHTFNNIMDYGVTLTVTDANGDSDMSSTTISVNDLPNEAPIAVISANPVSGFTPLTVDFIGSNSTDDNAVVTYLWDFADGTTSDLANPTHTFNNIMDYGVTLTITDANGVSDMASTTISVNDLPNEAPIAVISANPVSGFTPLTVDFIGSNSTDDNGVVTYLWDFADGTTSDLANPTHTFNNVLNYVVTLTVTDANGIADMDSITILVNENEPLNIPKELKDIIIYPNPVRNETLKIDLSKFMNEGLNIGFYDIYGKLVFQKMIDPNHDDLLEIDLSILSNGVYLMELVSTTVDDSTIKKVVKIE